MARVAMLEEALREILEVWETGTIYSMDEAIINARAALADGKKE
jgi:hypothetical protein